jgi:hypothetical protein
MGCKGDEVGGGSPRDPECSALEVECPDVSEGFAHSHGTII